MSEAPPLLSICVPQYERTDHFIAALGTFAAQRFRDFEVVVSDGGSTPECLVMIARELDALGLRHVLSPSPERLRYDQNLRRAIGLSSGRWCLLMGNDDGLVDRDALGAIADALERHAPVAAAICNYREVASGAVYPRAATTAIVGSGTDAAVRHYRSFAFVSGVVFDGPGARALDTAAVDGSEMYQMYLAAALLSAGGRLLNIDRVAVDKDLCIPGVAVDSAHAQARIDADAFVRKPLPMVHIVRTVLAGVTAGAGADAVSRVAFRIALQLYCFTFPFWSVEWRRVLTARLARTQYARLHPRYVLDGVAVGTLGRALLIAVHTLGGWFGAVVPLALFDRAMPWLYGLAKRVGSGPQVSAP